MRAKRLLLWLAVLFLWTGGAQAYVFDAVDVSSKARGMGGAWVAGADDASAIFYNPAALVVSGQGSLSASYLKPNSQDFESLTFLAVAAPVKGQGVAISYRRFGVEYRDTTLLTESTLSAAHGLVLMKDIHSSLAFGYCLNL